MTLRHALPAMALAFTTVGAWAAGPQRWSDHGLNVRLIEAGYARDMKSGAWIPELELRFSSGSSPKAIRQNVQVQWAPLLLLFGACAALLAASVVATGRSGISSKIPSATATM